MGTRKKRKATAQQNDFMQKGSRRETRKDKDKDKDKKIKGQGQGQEKKRKGSFLNRKVERSIKSIYTNEE